MKFAALTLCLLVAASVVVPSVAEAGTEQQRRQENDYKRLEQATKRAYGK